MNVYPHLPCGGLVEVPFEEDTPQWFATLLDHVIECSKSDPLTVADAIVDRALVMAGE